MLKLILVWCQVDMIMGCYYVVAEYTILLQYVVTSNNSKRKKKAFSIGAFFWCPKKAKAD